MAGKQVVYEPSRSVFIGNVNFDVSVKAIKE